MLKGRSGWSRGDLWSTGVGDVDRAARTMTCINSNVDVAGKKKKKRKKKKKKIKEKKKKEEEEEQQPTTKNKIKYNNNDCNFGILASKTKTLVVVPSCPS